MFIMLCCISFLHKIYYNYIDLSCEMFTIDIHKSEKKQSELDININKANVLTSLEKLKKYTTFFL